MAKSRIGKLKPSAPPKPTSEWKPRYADAAPKRKGGSVFSGAERRLDLIALIPALVLGALLYLNTLPGEFVYDDQRQIVRNILIQDDSQIWHALTSDVWAFKGGAGPVSNYWRPSFVLWMIVNYRLFGLDPYGWHATNVLLHLLVIALAFMLLRRLGLSQWVAGAIVLIFAVHPAHSESVAWIAGVPDIILSLALLGSMWFVKSLSENRSWKNWIFAIGLYVIALGAKEVALLYPLIVVAMLWRPATEPGEGGASLRESLRIAGPFIGCGALYLLLRQSILGQFAQAPEGSAGLMGTILTAPAVFVFYLRQILFPLWIGPSYPLRAVTSATIGFGNFVVPLLISLVVVALMIWIAKGSRTARIGLALFALPLLPAMNIGAFFPEQLVHDRYLYLPLLGFLVLFVPLIARAIARFKEGAQARDQWLIYAVAAILCVPLGIQTFRYNFAWRTNLALWEWGVKSDPNSSYNFLQYGVELHLAKRYDDALIALNRSLAIRPLPNSYLARSRVLMDQGRFAEADRDLREVTKQSIEHTTPYTMYQAYETIAVADERQGKMDAAANSIVEARQRLPIYSAALTEKLAIILYQGGKKPEAYAELAAMRGAARTETLPESKLLLYRLGLLGMELGKTNEARSAFQEFLSLTAGAQDAEMKQARAESEAALARLPR